MVDKKTASLSVIRQINETRIIELLRTHGALSRSDLARHVPMAKATVSRLISGLEERNLVRRIGEGDSRRGPKPVLYEFNAQAQIVIGIDVRRDECVAVATDLEATPVMRLRRPLANTQFATVAETLTEIVTEVRSSYPDKIAGVGLGIPGVYDDETDRLLRAHNLGWHDIQIKEQLEPRIQLPLHIANRANTAALAEKWYGAGQGYSNILYVSISSGVGAGIILNDELYEGSNGSAGEIGHLTIIPNGIMCHCGKRGCLETVASTMAIARRIHDEDPALLSLAADESTEFALRSLLQKLSASPDSSSPSGNGSVVADVLREVGHAVGIAIAHSISVLNPQLVVIGGLASYAPPFFAESIEQSARAHASHITEQATAVAHSTLGDDAVATGAAALLLSKFFDPYVDSFGITVGLNEFAPLG